MSVVGRTSRDPTGSADQAVERWLSETGARLDPDPLFRRRLRSDVMNAWVATREGLGQRPRRRWFGKRMGSLGRACLYASVALLASVAGVMAASSQAVPGEPLYAVKLRIEELRIEVLPAQFQDELAVNALAERIQEMQRLAASGAAAEAVALVPAIERQYADLERLLAAGTSMRSEFLGHRLTVVARLVDSLPAGLRAIVTGLMPGLPSAITVVDADEPEPSPSGDHAAPAQPESPAEPPAVPDAQPNADALAPSNRTDPGVSEEREDDDDDEEDDDDDSEDRRSEGNGS